MWRRPGKRLDEVNDQTMRSKTLNLIFLTLLTAVAAANGPAQVKQTPNTLKFADGASRPKATLKNLKMLVGHWQGEMFGAKAEEVWLEPAGGAMIGMFRIVNDKSPMFYEFWAVVEEEGSVTLKLKHFNPDMTGWEEKDKMVTFRLVKFDRNNLWFEGLTYSRQKDGSIRGFVAISEKDGSVKEASFTLRRTTR